jgi:SRSO17 transposase
VPGLMKHASCYGRYFHTKTSRVGEQHTRSYLFGLAQAARGRKNLERMEEAVAGMDYENVQQFISNSRWDHEGLNRQVAQEADGLLGGASDRRLIIDESSFSKQGNQISGSGSAI